MRAPMGLRVLLVTGALLAALLAMVAHRQWPLVTGREVVLATVPVDPRDLLRGDYVALAYDVSRLPEADMALPEAAPGDTLYVTLHGPDADGLWHAAAVQETPPAEDGALFLRGTVTSLWYLADDTGTCPDEGCRTLGLTYGIESYFVPENTGTALEDLARDDGGRLAVIIAVDAKGRAVIAGLRIDGQRVSREGLF